MLLLFSFMFQHSALSFHIYMYFEEQQTRNINISIKKRAHTHKHSSNIRWHHTHTHISTYKYRYFCLCVSTPPQTYMAIVRLNDCEKFSKVVFFFLFQTHSIDVNLSHRLMWVATKHVPQKRYPLKLVFIISISYSFYFLCGIDFWIILGRNVNPIWYPSVWQANGNSWIANDSHDSLMFWLRQCTQKGLQFHGIDIHLSIFCRAKRKKKKRIKPL